MTGRPHPRGGCFLKLSFRTDFEMEFEDAAVFVLTLEKNPKLISTQRANKLFGRERLRRQGGRSRGCILVEGWAHFIAIDQGACNQQKPDN